MLLALLLASATRCASPEACPSDAEVLALINDHHLDQAIAWTEGLGEGSHVHAPARATRLAQVRCGQAWTYESRRRVNCSFDYRQGQALRRSIATLVLSSGEWSIAEILSVELSRRQR